MLAHCRYQLLILLVINIDSFTNSLMPSKSKVSIVQNHIARGDWCSVYPNNMNPKTITVSQTRYGRYLGATVWLWCASGNANKAGNGTYILATCGSSADGLQGVWGTTEWCCTFLISQSVNSV